MIPPIKVTVSISFRLLMAVFCCACLFACASTQQDHETGPLSNTEFLPKSDLAIAIPNLSNCTGNSDATLNLNKHQPVTVIVHGCNSSAGRFRSLADVYAFHGQQTICFNYNDRDSLEVSSAELITAVEKLSEELTPAQISVIGHSLGGLVARRAFINDRTDRFAANETELRLVTISTPFGGIESAAHCGSSKMAWFSLGITKVLCQWVTGAKYREIPPNSEFINEPGQLIPSLNEHLKIATDELNSCRRYNDQSECIEDDYVFSLDEQSQQAIESDNGLSSVQVRAGHVEIVGNGKNTPTKLIEILQLQGYLNPTPVAQRDEFAELLAHLYLDDPH